MVQKKTKFVGGIKHVFEETGKTWWSKPEEDDVSDWVLVQLIRVDNSCALRTLYPKGKFRRNTPEATDYFLGRAKDDLAVLVREGGDYLIEKSKVMFPLTTY